MSESKSKTDAEAVSESKRCWFPTSPQLGLLIVQKLRVNDMLVARCSCRLLEDVARCAMQRVTNLAIEDGHSPLSHGPAVVLVTNNDRVEHCLDMLPNVEQLDLSGFPLGDHAKLIGRYAPKLRSLVLLAWCSGPLVEETIASCTKLERLVCSSNNAVMLDMLPLLKELQVTTYHPDAWCRVLARNKPALERFRLEPVKRYQSSISHFDVDHLITALTAHKDTLRQVSVTWLDQPADVKRLCHALAGQLDKANLLPRQYRDISDLCSWQTLDPRSPQTHLVIPETTSMDVCLIALRAVKEMPFPERCVIYLPENDIASFRETFPQEARRVRLAPSEWSESWRFWTRDL